MNDKEILKGLKCCAKEGMCKGCPYECNSNGCMQSLLQDTLMLVKRLMKGGGDNRTNRQRTLAIKNN